MSDYYQREDVRGFTARVKREAKGQWPEILSRIGIPRKALTKRNKPCPACGGVDRFSFLDNGYGAFVCRSLDSEGGDGFGLIQHFRECSFRDAVRLAGEAMGLTLATYLTMPPLPAPNPHIGETAPPVTATNGAPIKGWDKARALTRLSPAGLYLKSRGLAVPESGALRYSPHQPYYDDGGAEQGRWPALLARVDAADGTLAAVHRTYVTHAGMRIDRVDAEMAAKKLWVVRRDLLRGAAIRLCEPREGRLALAEGIETALAVSQQTGLPAWSCVSAWGLENVALPDDVTDVWVFGDNDRSGHGQRSASRAARRLMDEGRRVRVRIPSEPGTDWLDVARTVTAETGEVQA